MIPEELERLILKSMADGKIPFFVNATAGTTVLGAYDPLNAIADICEKYKLWFHVDVILSTHSFQNWVGCLCKFLFKWAGGLGWRSAAVRKVQKSHLRRNCKVRTLLLVFKLTQLIWTDCRADSVTWNPHKLMSVLLQCSTVHFKENVTHSTEVNSIKFWLWSDRIAPTLQSLLYHCNRMCADYLFQQDKHYDVTYDTGDKVIQCGRHNDIFKLWLTWRAKVTLLTW